ncbi:MAG: type II toxin-antitoxin system tRNA(fMet)-specific endonuclease VapC [Panacagrimonas sp.]
MLKYLLDTNICIYTIKSRPESIRRIFMEHDGQMCVSCVTQMELVYGAEKSAAVARNLKEVEGFLARLEVMNFDSAAATHAGQIRAELAKRGTPIGPYDQMIAGHARSLGLTVVTNNVGEFSRVPGIRLENWVR